VLVQKQLRISVNEQFAGVNTFAEHLDFSDIRTNQITTPCNPLTAQAGIDANDRADEDHTDPIKAKAGKSVDRCIVCRVLVVGIEVELKLSSDGRDPPVSYCLVPRPLNLRSTAHKVIHHTRMKFLGQGTVPVMISQSGVHRCHMFSRGSLPGTLYKPCQVKKPCQCSKKWHIIKHQGPIEEHN
jgi:hypothetical protein